MQESSFLNDAMAVRNAEESHWQSSRVVLLRDGGSLLYFSRANEGDLVPVIYQPPRSRSRRVSDLKVPVIWKLNKRDAKNQLKGGNRDVIERYDTHKGDIRKIRHSGPGWSGVWNLRVV